jgi:uncharacterized protein YkwD
MNPSRDPKLRYADHSLYNLHIVQSPFGEGLPMAVRRTFFLLITALLFFPASPTRAQSDAESAARDVIAQINAYRLENNLQPLAVNARLETMARDQALYVTSLPTLPEGNDMHIDGSGRTARQRALLDPYHWETYGSDVQVSVGENAGEGSVNFVMNFWKNSDIHNQALLNPTYREIGVWAIPDKYGYVIFVDLGGRPDVLPVLVDPLNNELYISNEYYTQGNGNWLREAKTIRLFNASGEPLTGVIPWQNQMPVPANAGDKLFVLFDDGRTQLIQQVDLQRDWVLLPDTLALEPSSAAPAVAAAASATPVPTSAPALPVASATPVQAAATAVPTPTIPAASIAPTLAAPAPTATLAPASAPTSPDIRLIYDDHSLTLLNITDRRIDISGVAITGGGITLATTRWTVVAPVLLDDFMVGGCLQVWSWDEPMDLPQPAACTTRLSYIYTAPGTLFWTQGDFSITQGGAVIATCAKGAGTCDAALR